MKHYFREKYNTLPRWVSYHAQSSLVQRFAKPSESILELGLGNGVVTDYLRKAGFDIDTFDIDRELRPNVVGSIDTLPFKDGAYDMIYCYEVLEHLPLFTVLLALDELRRVARRYVILSVPYSGFCLGFYIKPFFSKGRIFRIPSFFQRPESVVKAFDLEHYWTLGEGLMSVKKFEGLLYSAGFSIVKQLSPILNSHHIFYVLKVVAYES